MLPDTSSIHASAMRCRAATAKSRVAGFTKNGVLVPCLVGLVVGTLMSIITEYYTMGKRPVMSIIRQSAAGHTTNIIVVDLLMATTAACSWQSTHFV